MRGASGEDRAPFRILFHIEHPYYISSLEPVVARFRDDTECDLFYTAGKNHTRRLGVFLVREREGFRREIEALGITPDDGAGDFDAVVGADPLPHPERYPGALLVNLDHGPGFKTLRYRNLLRQRPTPYHLFVEGRYREEMLREYGIHEFCTIHPVGHHKLDPVHAPDYPSRDTLLRSVGLDPDRPVVLFAPSYKPSCIPLIGERIAELTPEYQLLIKLHPYSWRGKYAPHRQHRLYRRLARMHPEIRLLPRDDHNVVPWLHAADTLVSDASSVILEFLALGKPGVVVRLDPDAWRHSDGEPHLATDPAHLMEGPYEVCDSADGLAGAVSRSLQVNEARALAIRRLQEYIFHAVDGRASERIHQTVKKLLHARTP